MCRSSSGLRLSTIMSFAVVCGGTIKEKVKWYFVWILRGSHHLYAERESPRYWGFLLGVHQRTDSERSLPTSKTRVWVNGSIGKNIYYICVWLQNHPTSYLRKKLSILIPTNIYAEWVWCHFSLNYFFPDRYICDSFFTVGHALMHTKSA